MAKGLEKTREGRREEAGGEGEMTKRNRLRNRKKERKEAGG